MSRLFCAMTPLSRPPCPCLYPSLLLSFSHLCRRIPCFSLFVCLPTSYWHRPYTLFYTFLPSLPFPISSSIPSPSPPSFLPSPPPTSLHFASVPPPTSFIPTFTSPSHFSLLYTFLLYHLQVSGRSLHLQHQSKRTERHGRTHPWGTHVRTHLRSFLFFSSSYLYLINCRNTIQYMNWNFYST